MKKIVLATFVAAAACLTACDNSTPGASLKSDIDTLSYEIGFMMSPSESELAGYLTQQGTDSAYVDEFIKGYLEGIKSADDKKKTAYNLGLQAGMQAKQQIPMIESQIFQGDSTKKVSVRNYIAGFTANAKQKKILKVNGEELTKQTANAAIMGYMFGKQRTESDAFMAQKAKEAGVKTLDKGILYKEITKGTGTEHCTANDSVTIKYEGRLANGDVFDTSERQPGGTVTLSLKNVIEGWKIAIPAMTVGSTWEIYIPYEQGYGERGTGPIPPFSALIFKVTLLGVAK